MLLPPSHRGLPCPPNGNVPWFQKRCSPIPQSYTECFELSKRTIHFPSRRSSRDFYGQVEDEVQVKDRSPTHREGQPGNEVTNDLANATTSDPGDPEDHMVLT
ncbi:hypothetical protein TNCV_1928571 [Trichonephila clavipes]|nr:hypothetical protein TNCV_1928571 [Trichonephila clavipes]